nr:MAG TPA: hypothetical protein [Caudoviricetes sp.]
MFSDRMRVRAIINFPMGQIQSNHRPSVYRQRNSNRIKWNFQSRTGKLVSIDICPIADRFHITRKIRVSNMFIVLCFPLGCFMPCQPHGVVSDLGKCFLCFAS